MNHSRQRTTHLVFRSSDIRNLGSHSNSLWSDGCTCVCYVLQQKLKKMWMSEMSESAGFIYFGSFARLKQSRVQVNIPSCYVEADAARVNGPNFSRIVWGISAASMGSEDARPSWESRVWLEELRQSQLSCCHLSRQVCATKREGDGSPPVPPLWSCHLSAVS